MANIAALDKGADVPLLVRDVVDVLVRHGDLERNAKLGG
jgi:hypothetical protein